ncbi:hypothetical protein BU619_08045 [Staphylococcus capitis]|nr:hypothetical protein BU619_08045 [Staphylococcus capitis]
MLQPPFLSFLAYYNYNIMCAVTTQFIRYLIQKKAAVSKDSTPRKDVEKCTFQNTSTLLKWSEKKVVWTKEIARI